MKRKVLVILMIIAILFNFTFANDAYAKEAEDTKMINEYRKDNATPENGYMSSALEGDGKSNEEYGSTAIGTVVGLLAAVINLLAFQIDLVMSQLSYATEDGPEGQNLQYFFTIERAVFNRIPLFNIDFFDTEGSYKVGDYTITSSESINKIKERVAQMFYLMRVVATGAGLLVLIYIGIRMSISTLAEDKAKYKKMLIGWVESIVILFFLQYIMVAFVLFSNLLTEIFFKLEISLLGTTTPDKTFEAVIREQLLVGLFSTSGMDYALNTIMYICLLFMQAKYFWTYIKRVLMVGFLIMIAPLITITYGIDKAGDGKAQAFGVWMKEYAVNVLIQPLHALIYLVFVLSAGEIAKISPIIALAFLMCMGVVERMVKVIFDLKGLVSLRGLDKLGKKQ